MIAIVLALGLSQQSLAQREGSLNVNIQQVESSAAQATVYLTVTDQDHIPVVGLTEEQFSVSVEGTAVPRENITVSADASRGMGFVLAVDLSLDSLTDLPFIKESALDFVDGLGPDDTLLLMTFYEDSEILFTGPMTAQNQTRVRDIINGMSEIGSSTAFYDSMARAVSLLNDDTIFTQPRRAVTVITNVGNNVESSGLNTSVDTTLSSPYPIHIISFGTRAPIDELVNVAQTTGGQIYNHITVSDAPVVMRRLKGLIRQGYRLTFVPPIDPDLLDEPVFVVRVTNFIGNASAQADGTFNLVAADVGLTLLGVQDIIQGQDLSVQATVDSEVGIAEVRFRVDEGAWNSFANPPFEFIWGSGGATPGPHVLLVQAIDRAGSVVERQANFEVLTNEADLGGTEAFIPVSQVVLGQPFYFEAQLPAGTANIVTAQFYMEGQFLSETTTTPYAFTLSPDNDALYPRTPGPRTVSLRTINRRNEASERDIVVIDFVPAPNLTVASIGWQQILVLMAVWAIMNILILLILILWRSHGRQVKQAAFERHFSIKNLGNVSTAFWLEALHTYESKHEARYEVDFAFKYDSSQVLPAPYKPIDMPELEPAEIPDVVDTPNTGVQETDEAAAGQQGPGMMDMQQAAGQRAQGCMQLLSSISMLPVVGRFVQPLMSQMQAGQVMVSSAQQQSNMLKSAVSRTKQSAESLSGAKLDVNKAQESLKQGVPAAGGTSALPNGVPLPEQPDEAPPNGTAPADDDPAATAVVDEWVPSPVGTGKLLPGQKLQVHLRMQPKQRFRQDKKLLFKIVSTPMGLLVDNGDAVRHQVTKQGQIALPGLSPLYLYTPNSWIAIVLILGLANICFFLAVWWIYT